MEPEPGIDDSLRAFRSGDPLAAARLVESLKPLVSRIVAAHRPTRVPHEDLCQDVFMSVFTDIDRYRGPQPFAHRVSRVAVTTCLDVLRREKHRPELRWADLSENERAALDRALAGDAANDPAERRDARELVGHLLAQLSPENRLVITLLSLEERTVEEISRLTGWSISRVKVRAFRARQKMAAIFKKLHAARTS